MTNVPPAGLRVLSSEIMAVQVSGGVRMHVRAPSAAPAGCRRAVVRFCRCRRRYRIPADDRRRRMPAEPRPAQLVDDPRVALAVPVFVDARHITAAVFAPAYNPCLLDDLITGKEREKCHLL